MPLQEVTLAKNQSTAESSVVLAGTDDFDPTSYGNGAVFRFVVVWNVSLGSLTGNVVLYDVTGAATIDSTTTSSTSPVRYESATLTLTAANHIYEVRFYVTGGTTQADIVALQSARISIAAV